MSLSPGIWILPIRATPTRSARLRVREACGLDHWKTVLIWWPVCPPTQGDPLRPIVMFTNDNDNDTRHVKDAVKAGVSAYIVAKLSAERIHPIF